MKKAAFTLIELLVVICIIALLAGIALPVFNKVLEKSRATTDANNLKQIGLGVAAYVNDNDEQMFSSTGAGGGGGGGGSGGSGGGTTPTAWPQALQQKYVTSWKVFRSPFDKATSTRPDSNESAASSCYVSYGINDQVLTQSKRPSWDGNVSTLAAPSQLILMAPAMTKEASTPTFDATNTGDKSVTLTMPPKGTSAMPRLGTHSGRAQINALFADAHVESMNYSAFVDHPTTKDANGNDLDLRWLPLGK